MKQTPSLAYHAAKETTHHENKLQWNHSLSHNTETSAELAKLFI